MSTEIDQRLGEVRDGLIDDVRVLREEIVKMKTDASKKLKTVRILNAKIRDNKKRVARLQRRNALDKQRSFYQPLLEEYDTLSMLELVNPLDETENVSLDISWQDILESPCLSSDYFMRERTKSIYAFVLYTQDAVLKKDLATKMGVNINTMYSYLKRGELALRAIVRYGIDE